MGQKIFNQIERTPLNQETKYDEHGIKGWITCASERRKQKKTAMERR